MKTVVLAGTRKGLFTFSSTDRADWKPGGPFQPGREINHAVCDPRTRRLFATSNDAWFGSEIVWSDDEGQSWTSAKKQPNLGDHEDLKLERIWHIEPGVADQPDTLYAGVAPAALFRSQDRGESWDEIKSLSGHPSRPKWHPGAGGLCLHSISLDPQNDQRMFVGISAVGVFRTEDGGQTWHTANKGTRAEFMPDKYPEYGQCVHKLLLAPADSKQLFQQNHCGVYRSEDDGHNWTEITEGLPSDFGFPLAIHPREPQTLYVIPLQGAEFRCPPDGKLRVYRSRDGGRNWTALTKGLPQSEAYPAIYRENMATDASDPAGIYFGTNTGKIYASIDEGDSWSPLADNLPPVTSVEIAQFE